MNCPSLFPSIRRGLSIVIARVVFLALATGSLAVFGQNPPCQTCGGPTAFSRGYYPTVTCQTTEPNPSDICAGQTYTQSATPQRAQGYVYYYCINNPNDAGGGTVYYNFSTETFSVQIYDQLSGALVASNSGSTSSGWSVSFTPSPGSGYDVYFNYTGTHPL